jgi:hypothetical protein
MLKTKLRMLDPAHVPVDAGVNEHLGHIDGDLTNLFHTARTLRKLQAAHAPAVEVNVPEEELQANLVSAFLTAEKAEEAFPTEQDATAAGSAVAAATGAPARQ